MTFDDYQAHDALGLADLVARGEASPRELLDAAMARADAVNPALNAVVRRQDDAARATAQGPLSGPFAGVPFLVKDLFQEMAGVPCSYGSRAAATLPAAQDSDVVRRWRQGGLVIFGQTNTPEFGSKNVSEPLQWGPARNPWDLTRTTGGSSGGSAAAVAAGIVPVAGANDGGGSIRIPAGACGLFGLKPARGRVSMGPLASEGLFGAAVQGVVSRSVRDSAAMLDLLQGPEAHSPYWMPSSEHLPEGGYLQALKQPPRPLRIGYSTESPIGTPVDPQAVAAVEDAARLLTDLGHHVERAAPAVDGHALSRDFLQAWFCMQATLIEEVRAHTGAPLSHFETDTRVMAALGQAMSGPDLIACQSRWHTYTLALADFHARHDLWLTPTLAGPALPIGQNTTPPALQMGARCLLALGAAGLLKHTNMVDDLVVKTLAWTPYTQLANLTGRPAMSVPLYWTPQGLPLGVQFVGPLNAESWMLQLAAQLEAARPWRHRRPTLR
ncbi:MAG: amidase [Rubrivivax sp.]|nr:MAG: amidase [Rubrivivax sp.]